MSHTLKLIGNDPPGRREIRNLIAAGNVANDYDINIVIITLSQAGMNAKAPSVYLDDRIIAETGSLRNGIISEEELVEEFKNINIPAYMKST